LEDTVHRWGDQGIGGTLRSIFNAFEGANSVITIDNTLSFRVESNQEIEAIVREKSSLIEGGTKQLSNRLSARLSFHIEFVHSKSCLQVFLQGQEVSIHTRCDQDTFIGKFEDLGSISRDDVIANTQSGISSSDGEVGSGDG